MLEAGIQQVAHTPAHEKVARQLQGLMQQGALEAGDRLPPERELAKQFGVSRSTIRQALFILQTIGLVESRVGYGTFTKKEPPALNVTDLASALRAAKGSLVDQLELRRLVEPQVASLAAERATESELDELSKYISHQEEHLSDARFIDADSAFHLTIAHATGNTLLVKMVEGIHELLHESRQRSWRAGGGTRALEEHRNIYEAIRKHDSQTASNAMTHHILDVERLTLESITQSDAGVD